jgi:hypothetical protein
MKYVQDVNKSQFARSRAFSDAVKVGVGWLEAGLRRDPTKFLIYDRYESWRNMLWDSYSVDMDLGDCALPGAAEVDGPRPRRRHVPREAAPCCAPPR